MTTELNVAAHYTRGDLLQAIDGALAAMGKDQKSLAPEDLAPVDEFHIGGRQASADLFDQLQLTEESRVLDLGCGLGGPDRFMADRYGLSASGIDLTDEFVETGKALNARVGLAERVNLVCGSALDLPQDIGTFDAVTLMHVGMNIADKAGLARQAARALKPGGLFAVYDVMKTGTEEIDYPVPWAATAETSFLATPDDYRAAMEQAGLTVVAERSRRDFALAFFQEMKAKMASDGPPPLGLHILMGASAKEKVGNMLANVEAGRIAPVEIIARK